MRVLHPPYWFKVSCMVIWSPRQVRRWGGIGTPPSHHYMKIFHMVGFLSNINHFYYIFCVRYISIICFCCLASLVFKMVCIIFRYFFLKKNHWFCVHACVRMGYFLQYHWLIVCIYTTNNITSPINFWGGVY